MMTWPQIGGYALALLIPFLFFSYAAGVGNVIKILAGAVVAFFLAVFLREYAEIIAVFLVAGLVVAAIIYTWITIVKIQHQKAISDSLCSKLKPGENYDNPAPILTTENERQLLAGIRASFERQAGK